MTSTQETAIPTRPNDGYRNVVSNWFDSLIESINLDKFMMEEGIAPVEKRRNYDDMIFGNMDIMSASVRVNSTKHFLAKLIVAYINNLKKFEARPIDLAFDLSDAKVLVWSKIHDNDESSENALILAEAETNAEFMDVGFYISTTVVEQSDGLNVPPHYQLLNLTSIGLVQ